MNKTLIIIRHAHRETQQGQDVDNGLSDRGRKQVRKLFDYFFLRFPDMEKPVLMTSPKKRCVETLEPLARKLERKLVTNTQLTEYRGDNKKETRSEFKKRIRSFLKEWEKSKSPLTIICTHGDWIPHFFKETLGTSIHLKKGGWAELECSDGPQLTWLIQSF